MREDMHLPYSMYGSSELQPSPPPRRPRSAHHPTDHPYTLQLPRPHVSWSVQNPGPLNPRPPAQEARGASQ